MKVGSLVICLVNFKANPHGVFPIQKDTILTVREIVVGKLMDTGMVGDGLLFEEIKNPCGSDGEEWSYIAKAFREIQPPMDINIEEITKQPLEYA